MIAGSKYNLRLSYIDTASVSPKGQLPVMTSTTAFSCPIASIHSLPTAGRSAAARAPLKGTIPSRPCRQRATICRPVSALQLDWSDPDTLIGAFGAVLGITLGIGIPAFFISRDNADEKRLEELRELNRETFKATGAYMTEEEIAAFRRPRWTDRREFADDD